MTEEALVAEGDKSQGVLLASGYIAGGTLAGVIFAFLNLSDPILNRLKGYEEWSTAHNPFFDGGAGGWSDVLGLIPFIILTALLYIVGREWWLSGGRRAGVSPPPSPRSFRDT
jgi:hypothetical protein